MILISVVIVLSRFLKNRMKFLLQGNMVEKEELPEKISIFSENVPNTNSGNYGCRHNTEPAKMMQNMEFKFYSDRRRRKMGSDMVCYWPFLSLGISTFLAQMCNGSLFL